MLLVDIIYSVFAQIDGLKVDPGSTFENLRQNSAVVGLLYIIVIIQSGVIVKLWLKIDKIQESRIADLKEMLDLKSELQELKELHYKKDK